MIWTWPSTGDARLGRPWWSQRLERHQPAPRPDYLRIVLESAAPCGWDTADYVLGKWNGDEKSGLPEAIETACDAIEVLLEDGVSAAMNRFNVRPKKGADLTENTNKNSLKGSSHLGPGSEKRP